jgi:hypothetical protein
MNSTLGFTAVTASGQAYEIDIPLLCMRYDFQCRIR